MDYKSVCKGDPITILQPAIQAGVLQSRDDGKFYIKGKINISSPWVFIKHDPEMKCHIWHHIYFNHCNFVHSRCLECFKVVVRPANIEATMELYERMKDLDRPSKIGWEYRKTVFGNFGAYFYHRGLESAFEWFPQIKEMVKGIELQYDPYTGKEIQPILKRGCTEFEHEIGPSDKWAITKEQLEMENTLDSIVVQDVTGFHQHDWLKNNVFRRWIHEAYSVGDPSVNTMAGEKLFPGYVTYDKKNEVQNGEMAERCDARCGPELGEGGHNGDDCMHQPADDLCTGD